MEIKREYYLDKLIKRQNNGLIKVITGIRRCGKSYLLNTLFYNYLIENGVDKDHIIRFAFDSADDLHLIGESLIRIEKEKRGVTPELFMEYIRSQTSGEGKYYLLLDEVQLLDCFESVLNGYLRKDNMDVYVTGSNAKFLSKDIITEFAGRGDEIHMYPLSFAEFMSVYKGDKYEGLADVKSAIAVEAVKHNELMAGYEKVKDAETGEGTAASEGDVLSGCTCRLQYDIANLEGMTGYVYVELP